MDQYGGHTVVDQTGRGGMVMTAMCHPHSNSPLLLDPQRVEHLNECRDENNLEEEVQMHCVSSTVNICQWCL